MSIEDFVRVFGSGKDKIALWVRFPHNVSKRIRSLDQERLTLAKWSQIEALKKYEWALYPNGRIGVPIHVRQLPGFLEETRLMELNASSVLLKASAPELRRVLAESDWDQQEQTTFAQLFLWGKDF